MRLNQFIAQALGVGRRKADQMVTSGHVTINGSLGQSGQVVKQSDVVRLNGKILQTRPIQTVMLNKPVGYVCSRAGQGSQTVYNLLPKKLHHLKSVGRLDKDSSGLLLLTNDGKLTNQLTHPSNIKAKHYVVCLNPQLNDNDFKKLTNTGVVLDDGLSKFDELDVMTAGLYDYEVIIHQGRNRQIRRTFAKLGYRVTKLHRTDFGEYTLGKLPQGKFVELTN